MCGTVLGPLTLMKEEEDWQESVLAKKDIYSHFRVIAGPGAAKGQPQSSPRNDNDMEPVFFNNYCAFAKQLTDMIIGKTALNDLTTTCH